MAIVFHVHRTSYASAVFQRYRSPMFPEHRCAVRVARANPRSVAMRMSTAYFAGAGTVVIAVAVGLGGGLLIAGIMNPKTPTPEATKLEHRSSETPAAPGGSQNSYLAATQAAATSPVVVAPAAANGANKPAEQPQAAADNKAQPATDNKTSPTTAAASAPAQPAASESSPTAANQQASAPEAAFAKASDADLKANDAKSRDADTAKSRDAGRRAEREHRRAERHQQWAERRRSLHQREPDLRDVEQAVRQDTVQRDPVPRDYRDAPPREYVVEPASPALPRFNLFDDDGD
jgi:hypothetical protein